MSKNEILLRRKGLVEIDTKNTDEENNLRYVATINKNIESLGYTLSPNVIARLARKDIKYLLDFSNELVQNLKSLVGADVEYAPFYANFPEEVMDMSEADLYLNAILHYINRDFHHAGAGEIFEDPQSEKIKKSPLMESTKLKMIDLGSSQDKENIIRNLLKSTIAYSAQDKKDIETYLREDDIFKYMPEKFENRENFAFIMSKLLDYTRLLPENFEKLSQTEQQEKKSEAIKKSIEDATKLKSHCKTATDVLRIYTGLCDGDISLADNSKFKAIPRPQRRFLLSLMEESSELSVHMSARPEKFKRAFRYLHVDEFVSKKGKKIFPETSKAINDIRDGKYERGFDSYLTDAIESEDLDLTLSFLVSKPGVFARKLDEVLRKFDDSERILFYFKQESAEINPRLLLTVRQHFKERMTDKEFRIFNPKGNIGKVFYTPNELTRIDPAVAQAVVNICDEALIKQFSTKGNMGKVYISEALKGYKAPMVLRNLNPESKIITRGSKFPVGENKDVLRSFIWWRDDSDFDLAVSGYDENWSLRDEISYRNYKTEYGCHSGDVTYQRDNGVDGECEFIDVNLRKARESGIRYLVFQVNNFSGRYMDEAECKFGYMERENLAEVHTRMYSGDNIFPNTGEIFEPLTVKNIMNLSAHTKTAMPFIVDTVERRIIWADMEMGSKAKINNVIGNLTGATAAAYSCVHDEKPELYDLLLLHAVARGELTDKKEDADEIFDIEEGTTPFDIDTIVARFLTTEKDEFCLEHTEGSKETAQKSKLEEVQEEKKELESENSDLDSKIKAQKEKAVKLFKKLEVLGLTEGMTLEEFLGVEIKDEQ